MDELSIFKNMNHDEINDILKSLGARRISFKKEHIIHLNNAKIISNIIKKAEGKNGKNTNVLFI